MEDKLLEYREALVRLDELYVRLRTVIEQMRIERIDNDSKICDVTFGSLENVARRALVVMPTSITRTRHTHNEPTTTS